MTWNRFILRRRTKRRGRILNKREGLTLISFVIPGQPIAQARPRATKRGKHIHMYDPKESREYKEYVSLIARQHAPKKPIEGALSVNIKIYRQIPKSTTKKDRALFLAGIKRPVVKSD